MVARGDLGVEMRPEQVPTVQRRILRACRRAGKPVIVATQMLESMITSPVPTRAEASDVATAVYDGADAVMLSAESASGQYPLEAVEIMDRIIREVEHDEHYRALTDAQHSEPQATAADAIMHSLRAAAHIVSASATVIYTHSGSSSIRASRERPEAPLLSLTPKLSTARRLALVWGVHSVLTHEIGRRQHHDRSRLQDGAGGGVRKGGRQHRDRRRRAVRPGGNDEHAAPCHRVASEGAVPQEALTPRRPLRRRRTPSPRGAGALCRFAQPFRSNADHTGSEEPARQPIVPLDVRRRGRASSVVPPRTTTRPSITEVATSPAPQNTSAATGSCTRAGVAEPVDRERDDVRCHTRGQGADVVAPEHGRAAQRRNLQRFARGQPARSPRRASNITGALPPTSGCRRWKRCRRRPSRRTPASRMARPGAMPDARRILVGQWATPVCVPRRAQSPPG